MPSRSPARLFAPLALGATLVAVLIVLSSSGGDDSSVSAPPPTSSRPAHTAATTTSRPKARTYVVKSGDTLSAIAEKTGVALSRIQSLNPDLDAQTLNAGDRVKLAP